MLEQYRPVDSAFVYDVAGRIKGPALCDFSSSRSDVCELKGDVRVLPNATIVIHRPWAKRQSWRMKPHGRKNDRHALARVTEVTVASSHHTAGAAPRCTVLGSERQLRPYSFVLEIKGNQRNWKGLSGVEGILTCRGFNPLNRSQSL